VWSCESATAAQTNFSVVHGTNVFHTQWRNVVSIGTIQQSTRVYADSNMRLTRHSSDSMAFEAPVNSSQHGVSAAGQLVIRFWAVTSWPFDKLTGTCIGTVAAARLKMLCLHRYLAYKPVSWQPVACKTFYWQWFADKMTRSQQHWQLRSSWELLAKCHWIFLSVKCVVREMCC